MPNSLEMVLSNRIYIRHNDKIIYYKSPSANLKNRASLIYNEVVQDHLFDEWPTKHQVRSWLIQNNIIVATYEKSLSELNKNIEDCKVRLYQAFFKDKERKKVAKELALLEERLRDIEGKVHSLDYITLEGYGELVKNHFIIKNSVFLGKKAYLGEDFEFDIYEYIINKINDGRPKYSELRALARHDEWGSIWRASKQRPFSGPINQWTDEQKSLVNITQMYDSVYKHPDCPVDDIINDDNMLDGWLIFQRRKNEAERKKNNTKNIVAGVDNGKGGDQFIFMGDEDDYSEEGVKQFIENINDLNDSQGKFIKGQRQQVIQKMGEATPNNFLDAQLEIAAQQRQGFMKNTKR